ncbi:hypothetical protein BZA70DRAFT_305031 [Myxozyma melibiosi]|uniref:Uncharacterized protein n=1 Tax=Myxozyma melibiosi TaxID=54550 RepID=A0ABR1F4N3_9ASCO
MKPEENVGRGRDRGSDLYVREHIARGEGVPWTVGDPVFFADDVTDDDTKLRMFAGGLTGRATQWFARNFLEGGKFKDSETQTYDAVVKRFILEFPPRDDIIAIQQRYRGQEARVSELLIDSWLILSACFASNEVEDDAVKIGLLKAGVVSNWDGWDKIPRDSLPTYDEAVRLFREEFSDPENHPMKDLAFYDEFCSLTQTGALRPHIDHFLALCDRMPEYSEQLAISRFVTSLKPELRSAVKGFKMETVDEAIRAAVIADDALRLSLPSKLSLAQVPAVIIAFDDAVQARGTTDYQAHADMLDIVSIQHESDSEVTDVEEGLVRSITSRDLEE